MRLPEITEAMTARGEKGLVPFFTAGFPDDETSLRLLLAAGKAGCRLIEIGIPFSDPIADGPLIQASSRQALANGMNLRKALRLAGRVGQECSAALVLMSYFNPILQMGIEHFADRARAAGVSGVILPDVPFEESGDIRATLTRDEITLIDLVAPTSGSERLERITRGADGFLYLVSVTGVTGVRSAVAPDLREFAGRVRAHTRLPLYIGFGVSSPAQAAETVRHADGVIIGSALVRIVQSSRSDGEAVANVASFLDAVQQAINSPNRSHRR
jgi:tryptophan synthase alpha chain